MPRIFGLTNHGAIRSSSADSHSLLACYGRILSTPRYSVQ